MSTAQRRGRPTSGLGEHSIGEVDDDRGLFDLGGLLMDLRELLGHNLDVVTEAGLRPRISQRVLADAVEL